MFIQRLLVTVFDFLGDNADVNVQSYKAFKMDTDIFLRYTFKYWYIRQLSSQN
jgi:hypothetical protein